jgi:hypothetical protein
MAEETVVAASSAVEESPVVEASRGPLVNWTAEQRAEFRKTGAIPKAPEPKNEESAPSKVQAKPEGEASEIEPASEPGEKPQEHGKKHKPTADERIAQLEATIEKIRKGAGIERKTEPAPVTQPPQQQHTRPKPTVDDKTADGKSKYAAYEDYIEDLADWKAEQRIAEAERTRAERAQQAQLAEQIEAARKRYENFDEVIQPAVSAVMTDKDVPPFIKSRLNTSEVLPDLAFTLGSKPEELAKFVQMAKSDPGRAIEYIAVTEYLIREELAKAQKPKAEAKPETPVQPKTSAPKPPAEVGGRGSTPPDVLTAAAQAGDFRTFRDEANRRDAARLKRG